MPKKKNSKNDVDTQIPSESKVSDQITIEHKSAESKASGENTPDKNVSKQASPEKKAPAKATTRPRIPRPNYWKYEAKKVPLRAELIAGRTIKELAESLNISVPTLAKYRNLISAEDNRIYKTPEEEAYLKNQGLQAKFVNTQQDDDDENKDKS